MLLHIVVAFVLVYLGSAQNTCPDVSSKGCSVCIDTRYAFTNGQYERCNWCLSTGACFDWYNHPESCDPTQSVTIAYSSKCIQFIGLPIATGIIVLLIAVSVPICVVILIVVCVRKAQAEQARVSQTVVHMPHQVHSNTYNNSRNPGGGGGYYSKNHAATPVPRNNPSDSVQPLLSSDDNGQDKNGFSLNNNNVFTAYVPPATPTPAPQHSGFVGTNQSQSHVLPLLPQTPEDDNAIQMQPLKAQYQPLLADSTSSLRDSSPVRTGYVLELPDGESES